MHFSKKLASFVLFATAAFGAPALSTIQDVVYKADGSLFNGTAYIQWKSFSTSDASQIGSSELTLPIRNGQLLVRLVPTANASGGAFYTVRYQSEGRNQFTEIWVVPSSEVTLKLKDVRIPATGPGSSGLGSAPLQLSDVAGLADALNLKVGKSASFTPSRAAIIDTNGLLSSAAGAASDCIRVDGTAGPCGGVPAVFVDLEVPSGTIDGTNRIFVLSSTPLPATSLHIYRNGILQRAAVDFTLSGNTLTFIPGATPQSGDILQASYRK